MNNRHLLLVVFIMSIVSIFSVNLAYGYPWISPYAFSNNNPVRYVDPDGRDVWEINQSGQVNWIEESKEHTMYALDRDGQRTDNSITVSDRSIFDNLAATGKNSNYKASFSGGNPSELASVFLFAADNSNAEWRFSRYDVGNGNQYAIGTVHNSSLAIDPEQMGFARKNEIAFAHSHPGAFTSLQSEHATMGWEPIAGSSSVFRSGDSWNVANRSSVYPSYNNSYVYFPYSGNIHHVRGNQAPALIRNLSNHNNNGQRLFWGTLNGR